MFGSFASSSHLIDLKTRVIGTGPGGDGQEVKVMLTVLGFLLCNHRPDFLPLLCLLAAVWSSTGGTWLWALSH